MFKTAYDTLACRAYNTASIEHAIKLAIIEGEINPFVIPGFNFNFKGVYGINNGNDKIPAFSHPFRMEISGTTGYLIDSRAYVVKDRSGEYSLTNAADFKFQVHRAVMNLEWEEDPNALKTFGELSPLVFCRWLTEAIVKRLGLNPNEQVRVTTVTLFYWFGLFREKDEEFSEKEKMMILQKLSQITAIPTTTTMAFVDEIPLMLSIQQYVDVLKNVAGSKRLESLNPALLFSMLSGSWFGLNAKETIAVAVEHPPTFVTIIEMALNNRSYRKSVLGRLTYEADKKGRGEAFLKNFYATLQRYV